IRTEELVAARQLDGARQYFSRAFDFGFSKTAEETFRFWPRDSLLADVVAVIRQFRPQILVSIFSGTPRDGHGQHQVAGLVTRQAFELLRDSSWGPLKLYRAAWFDTAATTLRLDGGALDPVTGFSYHQIAMAGRSRHRSQDMGQLERPGPSTTRLAFVAWRSGAGAGAGPGTAGAAATAGTTATAGARSPLDGDGGSLFAGVDTVLHGTGRYPALIDSARARLNPARPGTIVPVLARALHELGSEPAAQGAGSREGDAVAEQRETLARALAVAAGVVVDGVADDGIVIPGEQLQVETTVWNAGADAVPLVSIAVTAPPGWGVTAVARPDAGVAPGRVATGRYAVTVAPDAPRSQPYFLRRPLIGALYDWTGVPPAWRGLPAEPPPLEVAARVTIAGEPVTLRREVVYRYRDQGIGEVRRPIFVTQPFDVAMTPDLVVWPLDGPAGGPRHFTVTVTNRARGPAATQVLLTAPTGWAALPPESLSFQREDETKSRTVTVALPAGARPGVYTLEAAALTGGGRSEGALTIIDFPHIRPRPVVHPSTAELHAARIALPALTRVGYVRGASDRVPEALAGVGVPVILLDADTLARGDLSRYDAIVIGPRAYETDPALVASNGRVLDYARAGGLVIVQYQQYPFVNGNFAPYRLSLARPHDRVTD
ncbi:MAG TPA: NEW3 domain-containing protein, partial [Gemmatimonadales bacterium]|nr:NEW3 domain-containing protein [Gemmatimonadales bacterium]